MCYDYFLSDGVTSTRDIVAHFPPHFKGIVFDVTRVSSAEFNYQTLERCKNGYIMSGKYQGSVVSFETVPVVVFVNFYPDKGKLSEDRWDIHNIDLADNNVSTQKIQETFPFEKRKVISIIDEETEVQTPQSADATS